jgi:hypothetical protein
VPGSTGTDANGNSTHAIAGDFTDRGGNTHGFVLSGSTFTTIDVPGAAFSSVNGINAIGQLDGTYQDTVRFHAFFSSNGSSFSRSGRKAASLTRRAKLSGPTGIPIKNVMASSGATASTPIC